MAEASKDATQRLSAALDRIARAHMARAQAVAAPPFDRSPAPPQPDPGPHRSEAAEAHHAEIEALRGRLDNLIARLRDGLEELA